MHHPIDVSLIQVGAGRDRDGLLSSGRFIHSIDVKDSVGVYVKAHVNLRYAPGSRWDTVQAELAE